MEPKTTPLQIEDYVILKFSYNYIFPKKESINAPQTDYAIDINFGIKDEKQAGPNAFTVSMKISVNESEANKQPGHSIFIEAIGLFSLEPLNSHNKKTYGISAAAILLGNIRSSIREITSVSPIGSYFLPPFNLADLMDRKIAEGKKKKKLVK